MLQNLRLRERCGKGGCKDCKRQRIWEFAVRKCLLVTSGITPIMCHQHNCHNVNWTRMTPRDENGEEKSMRPQPYPKNYRYLREAGNGRSGLHQGRVHDGLPSAKWSSLRTYIQVTVYGPNSLYFIIYVYVFVYKHIYIQVTHTQIGTHASAHSITSSEKGGHELEKVRRNICENLEGEKGKEKCCVIISKLK